ncbi:hypothetical protein [Altererythrobacter sp. MF3-039]|uniref:hypothetical protein n=1 Tax=Altererythrobacter sp. MF3-039 TaxID=3252901 RepID=UPI00390C7331
MIGKVIGAFVGDKVAKQTTSIGGPTGAALGVLATSVIARMSIPAMVVLGAGGYAVKKYLDKQDAEKSSTNDNTPPKTSVAPATA